MEGVTSAAPEVAEGGRYLAGEATEPVGSYAFSVPTGVWRWADAIYTMHGFVPGEVVPTSELIVAHKHPDDRQGWTEVVDDCARTGRPFSYYHRIVDAQQKVRNVVAVGDGIHDPAGRVTGIRGYFVDLTTELAHEISIETHDAVAKANQSRAVIEQAKGALMLTYGLDATAAYVILCWRSQQDNIKLRELSQRLVDMIESGGVVAVETREQMDKLLADLA